MSGSTSGEGTGAESGEPLVLTKEQVAKRLQVPEGTVDNLHRCGELKGVKVGKHLRWRLADVKRYVEEL